MRPLSGVCDKAVSCGLSQGCRRGVFQALVLESQVRSDRGMLKCCTSLATVAHDTSPFGRGSEGDMSAYGGSSMRRSRTKKQYSGRRCVYNMKLRSTATKPLVQSCWHHTCVRGESWAIADLPFRRVRFIIKVLWFKRERKPLLSLPTCFGVSIMTSSFMTFTTSSVCDVLQGSL